MFIHILGKFRHLPVVENGEVIAMLDIAKCLYDAISRLEKAAEQGSALAAAVEGVERQVGDNLPGFLLHIVLTSYFPLFQSKCSLLHKNRKCILQSVAM